MGCGSSTDAQVASSTAPVTMTQTNPPEKKELSPVLVDEPPKGVAPVAAAVIPKTVTFSQVHSAIRWNKPLEDIIPLLNAAGAPMIQDPKTGNHPIHIAAQNGHFEILKYLVDVCKVDVNASNNAGNTALHMAIEYDYLEVAEYLLAHGASKTICNGNGKNSGAGIEGTKSVEILAFCCAQGEENLLKALTLCEKHVKEIEKTSLATVGLKKKKSAGMDWTDEVQIKFKNLLDQTA